MMKAPVNLLDTLSADPGDPEGPSDVYVRHVVKSVLHHAVANDDMREAEAEKLWLELGFPPKKWALRRKGNEEERAASFFSCWPPGC